MIIRSLSNYRIIRYENHTTIFEKRVIFVKKSNCDQIAMNDFEPIMIFLEFNPAKSVQPCILSQAWF